MSENTSGGGDGAGGQRRVGQVVVTAICIASLVVAGAIAPTLGTPFSGGPAVDAGALAGGDLANALADQNVDPSGVDPSAVDESVGNVSEVSGQGVEPPNSIGSGESYQVGGEEPLSGFRNQDGTVQFVVESPENTYYRVGAYQSFDGYGWSRSDEQTSFSGAVPGETPPGERIEMRVTLNASASSVPVPWKPTSVDGPVPLSVRETGGIVAGEPLQPNQSFTVTAVKPTRDSGVLSDTGYDYPTEIEETYVGVDDNVSPRVVSLADEVTADASNPYEEAVAIRDWLESNKEYSLNATTDSDRPVTQQFLFEMDEGYCQYFASAMAVMLRSQGIPARYVVGYAPGTKIGDSTYAVSSSKAHAWVEVYFEDVGWVRFDPTPAASRQAADERVADQSDVQESFEASDASQTVNQSDFEPSETGDQSGASGDVDGGTANQTDDQTRNETGDQTGDETEGQTGDETDDQTGDETDDSEQTDEGDQTNEGDQTSDGDQTDEESSEPSMNVSLNRTAAPGVDVTVSVTRAGQPVSGAAVYFNGEYVGTTDWKGEVVATVPYVRSLTITVTGPDQSVQLTGDVRMAGGAGVSDDGDLRRFDASRFADEAIEAGSVGPPDNESNETSAEFAVSAEMSFSFDSDPVPGDTVPVQVSIEGRPVSDATVSMDGDRVGRTNESGWVTVTLPDDRERVRLSAERDEVNDSAEVRLLTEADVNVSDDAVPGSTLDVTAEFDGSALADAAVFVDGERVGTTDAEGTATVDVPVDAEETLTVRVEDGVIAGSATVDVVTNATIEFTNPPSPGEDSEVVVTANGEPVEGADVAVENETLATTGGEGAATVSIPEDASGNVSVSATLGALSASREADLFDPNVSVTPAYLVPLPGAPVTVNVTDAGQPVEGASVAVDGTEAVTDENGTATATLPFQNAVSVEATALGASTETGLDWLFLNLFGVLATGAVLAVVAFGTVYDEGRLGRISARVRRLVGRVGRFAMNALFAIAGRVDDWLSRLPAVPALVRSFLERLIRAPVETLRGLGTALYAKVAAGVLALVAWLLEIREREGGEGDDAGVATAGEGVADGSAGDGSGDAGLSLRAAWRVLVALVSPRRLRTQTPGEIARRGIDDGLPSQAVLTVTDAYRRAVYGDRPPADSELASVREAATELERVAEDDSAATGESEPGTSDDGDLERGAARADGGVEE